MTIQPNLNRFGKCFRAKLTIYNGETHLKNFTAKIVRSLECALQFGNLIH